MTQTVLVIDDHPVVRVGIIKSLTTAGFTCVGQAGSLKEAIAVIALHNPQVITVDLNLPDGHGLEIVKWAREQSSTLIIIVLSLDDDLALVSAAAKAGAQGFISKASGTDLLISAIHAARVNPGVFTSNRSIELLNRQKHVDLFSPRERVVISYLAGELSISEIARSMFVSHSTVKTHINSIYRKLDTHSRQSAVSRAKTMGLI